VRRPLLRALLTLTGVVIAGLVMTAPAGALGGNPDMLPAGSTACTDWVRTAKGAYLSGYADYNPATFTTRMSTSPGGQETTIFRSVTREVSIHFPGNDYPTYRVLVTPPTSGTFFLRNCVTASNGPVYRFELGVQGNDPGGLADVGPHQATLGPGGRHCGDFVEGPSIGRDDGVARLVGSATAPVTFSITATDADYGFVGAVFSVTGTGVDRVFVPGADISSLRACVTNSGTATASASFELTAV
jgi:hypothetical protein